MKSSKERVGLWLNEALAMEQESSVLLNTQISRVIHYPDIQSILEAHWHETNRQIERLEALLEHHHPQLIVGHAWTARLKGWCQGLALSLQDDEVIETTMAVHAQAQMEALAYRVLSAGANELGEEALAGDCREMMQQELTMMERLYTQVPELVHLYLMRERIWGVTAKR